MALASAGVSAAIMLAACQDGAAQFLAWPSGGVGVAGAIAVRGAYAPSQAVVTNIDQHRGTAGMPRPSHTL